MIEACALAPDLKLLPGGILTEIGEKVGLCWRFLDMFLWLKMLVVKVCLGLCTVAEPPLLSSSRASTSQVARSSVWAWPGRRTASPTSTYWMIPCPLWTLMSESISLKRLSGPMEFSETRFVLSLNVSIIAVHNQNHDGVLNKFTISVWAERDSAPVRTDSHPSDPRSQLPATRRWDCGSGGWSGVWGRHIQEPACQQRSLFGVPRHVCPGAKQSDPVGVG